MAEEIGSIEDKRKEVEWEITDFFSTAKEGVDVKSHVFLFANISWYLQLKFKKPGYIGLALRKITTRECPVEYKFGFKKIDGSVEHLYRGIFNYLVWTDSCYIKLSELKRQKADLVPSGVLIITCLLERETVRSGQPKMSEKPELKNMIKLDTLSESLKNLFLHKDSCDVNLIVMEKEFKAHRAVLIARSSVFAAMFTNETTEKETGVVTIPDCDPESFEGFLEFLYCGKLEKPSASDAFFLYETADKYDIQELKTYCSEVLMENLKIENFCEVARMADKYDDMDLFSAVQVFFNGNYGTIFVTSEWECLLKDNYRLAHKLMIEMSKCTKPLLHVIDDKSVYESHDESDNEIMIDFMRIID